MLDGKAVAETVLLHRAFAKAVKVTPDSRAVIVNGKVIGPMVEAEEFNAGDFNLLEQYSMSLYGNKLKELVSNSDLAMKASSVLQKCAQSKGRHDVKFATDKYAVINTPAKVSNLTTSVRSLVAWKLFRTKNALGCCFEKPKHRLSFCQPCFV